MTKMPVYRMKRPSCSKARQQKIYQSNDVNITTSPIIRWCYGLLQTHLESRKVSWNHSRAINSSTRRSHIAQKVRNPDPQTAARCRQTR